jgi:hypothetical protein
MSQAERTKKSNKYWVDVQGERYLQVEQINNDLFKNIDNEVDSDDE